MIRKITDFEITINQDNVFLLMECSKDSKIYAQVVEEFEELFEESYKKIEPVALLAIGDLGEFEDKIKNMQIDRNEEVLQGIIAITSIGPRMSEWSTQLFKEGDYLKGMLVDAMADDYLFQMSAYLKPFIVEMCLEGNWGVDRRLEAPHDVPMDIQERAWELTNAKELAGIDIKKSFMYNPVKTTCNIFLLKENSKVFHLAHNCSTCPNLNCKLRKTGAFDVTVEEEDGLKVLSGESGESLLTILRRNNIPIIAPCGGRGTCGKCKIQVTEGKISSSRGDMDLFTQQELEAGYRLACHAYPEDSCAIKVISGGEEEFEVLITMEMLEGVKRRPSIKVLRDAMKDEGVEEASYGIAVDIGTTTIAMQLVELMSGKVEEVYTTVNSGRSFGADVISRIEASNKGEGEALRKMLLLDLQKGIEHFLLYKRELEEEITIQKMHIAANTTLIHLLMGVSCKTLGVSPFTPVIIDTMSTTYVKLFKGVEWCMAEDFPIMIFPGITTYVGGDIVAGLYGLDIEKQDKVSVLIDLGTNGEIAIGNKDKIMVSSTAAGPAFEGGNITCGVGSIPGGIYGVTLEGEKPLIQTIGNKAPIGICGTGVVEVVYELLREEFMDETGRLEWGERDLSEGFLLAYTEQGKEIIVTQKDIREIQLAKSAIRAGLETLMHHYGVTYDQVENIYIAGGFGYKLDINKAVGIGLLPREAKEKMKAVGNSALHGVNLSLLDSQVEKALQGIKEVSIEIHLGSDKKFNQLYMEYIHLG